MSDFSFIDNVSEVKSNETLTAFFTLKGNEEFLNEHFADFPVMPGVLQLESLRQAASRLLGETEKKPSFYRLQSVSSAKYGQFVKPGGLLKIFVRLVKKEDKIFHFEGRIDLMHGGEKVGRVVAADFTLAPVR